MASFTIKKLAFVKMFNLVILGNPDYQWKGVADPHSSVVYDYHLFSASEQVAFDVSGESL